MPLTDPACKAANCPPDKKRQRFADAGGLYLEVAPSGSKRWFYKYRIATAEKRLALGSYPEISLAAARLARDKAKLGKNSTGMDPVVARKAEKLASAVSADNTLAAVAKEWFDRQKDNWSPAHSVRVWRRLERDVLPHLGERVLAHIKPIELLAVLRKIEARGAIETADRALQDCGQVWRYGVVTARVERDICADLRGGLKPYRNTHFPAITKPDEFGDLIRACRAYKGGPLVRAALQLAPLVMLRPGELRHAQWAEFNIDDALWEVPSARMKRTVEGKATGEPHLVPLSRQAIAIIEELRPLTGRGVYVFPGERDHGRPMSDNAVRSALYSLGYGTTHSAHGFRASARTMLDERLGIDPNVIEAQLAHAVKDSNGRSYNRTQFLEQRREMMQRWADYIDTQVAKEKRAA